MKLFFKTGVKYIVLLVAGFQLLFTFCSGQLHHEPPVQIIERNPDDKKLNDITTEGANKDINTHVTIPYEIIETVRRGLFSEQGCLNNICGARCAAHSLRAAGRPFQRVPGGYSRVALKGPLIRGSRA